MKVGILTNENSRIMAIASASGILEETNRQLERLGKEPAFEIDMIGAKHKNVHPCMHVMLSCHKNIEEVRVFPERKFKNKRQRQRYSRYIQKVKKVYPLAVKARVLLAKYEPEYYALEKQSDRRKLMKKLEKELLAEHKEDLKTIKSKN